MFNNRIILLIPTANPYGYFHNIREEVVDGKKIDPNRDFPYSKNIETCMVTTTARSLYKILTSNIYMTGATFHAGMSAVVYP